MSDRQGPATPELEADVYALQAEVCQALAHPKRLQIIDLLREGEMTSGALAEVIGVPAPNLSQHLAILRQRRLVTVRREGSNAFYRIADERVTAACALMREVLLAQLTAAGRIASAATSQAPDV